MKTRNFDLSKLSQLEDGNTLAVNLTRVELKLTEYRGDQLRHGEKKAKAAWRDVLFEPHSLIAWEDVVRMWQRVRSAKCAEDQHGHRILRVPLGELVWTYQELLRLRAPLVALIETYQALLRLGEDTHPGFPPKGRP